MPFGERNALIPDAWGTSLMRKMEFAFPAITELIFDNNLMHSIGQKHAFRVHVLGTKETEHGIVVLERVPF